MRTFALGKISLVDEPAQEGADVVLRKRAFVIEKAKFAVMTSSEEGHAHLIEAWSYDGDPFAGTTSAAQSEGEEQAHNHPWMVNLDGGVVLGESGGHTHTVEPVAMLAAISRYGSARMEELVARAKNARATDTTGEPAARGTQGVGKDAGDPGEGDGMTVKNTPAAPSASGGTDEAAMDALQKRLARAEAMSALNDAGKTFLKGLSQDEQDSFLAKSVKDQDVAVAVSLAKAAEQDPIVYTDADGRTYRKSADPLLVQMAKRVDASETVAKAERARARTLELTKRAETELSNLPGDAVVKSALLGAIEQIADETTRTGIASLLKAANTANAGAFVRKGSSAGGEGAVETREDAEAALEKRARDEMARNQGMTYAKAYQNVLRTPEGAVLFQKAS